MNICREGRLEPEERETGWGVRTKAEVGVLHYCAVVIYLILEHSGLGKERLVAANREGGGGAVGP